MDNLDSDDLRSSSVAVDAVLWLPEEVRIAVEWLEG